MALLLAPGSNWILSGGLSTWGELVTEVEFEFNPDNLLMLLHADGPDGSTVFADSSNKLRSILASGNTKHSSVQSKFGSTSIYFDGSADFLNINPGMNFAGDFTIECFVYPTSSQDDIIGGSSSQNVQIFRINPSTGNISFFLNGTQVFSGTFAGITQNQWQHLAISRSGNQTKMFVNGVQIGSTNTSWTGSFNFDLIGGMFSNQYTGYIEEFRVWDIGIYTENFSVPSLPFPDPPAPELKPEDISLLLHMDGVNNGTTFTDDSLNAFSIATIAGSPKTSTSQVKYGTASGDFTQGGRLETPTNDAFVFNGDFTVELWVYRTAMVGSFDTVLSGANENSFLLRGSASGPTVSINGVSITSAVSFALNTWEHWAVVRRGPVVTVYTNGTAIASGVISGTVSCDKFVIGDSGAVLGRYFYGYIDDLRITKNFAHYVSDFEPPIASLPNPPKPANIEVPTVSLAINKATPTIEAVAATDPDFANVSLLLHMDGSNGSTTFADSSSNGLTVTASGNAQISTAESKWGTGALRTTRSTGALTLPSTALLELTGDFTIEFWVYAVQDRGRLLGFSAANSRFEINQNSTAETGANAYKAYVYNAGVELFDNVSFGFANQVWHHVALTRSGTSLRLFGGGTLYATRENSGTFTVNGIAGQSSSFIYFDGYIDDLRITKGVARYTANFTPPTAPFPDA